MDRKSRAGRPPVTVFPTLLPYELPRLEAIMVERISAHMHNLPLAKWGLVADYLRALIIKQLMYGFCTSTTKLCEVLCAMPPHLDHQGKGSGSIEQVCEMLQGVRGEMWDVALYAEQLGLLVESECRWDLPLKRQVNFDRLWEMVVQSDPLIGDLLKIDIHAAGVPSKYIDLVRRFAIATHVRTDADGWCRLKTAEFAAILAIVPDKCREIARCAHDIRVVLADYECDAGITLLTALPRQVNTSRIAELKSLSEGGLKPPPSSSKHGLLENHFEDVSPEPAAESRGDRIYLHGLGDLLIRAGLSEKEADLIADSNTLPSDFRSVVYQGENDLPLELRSDAEQPHWDAKNGVLTFGAMSCKVAKQAKLVRKLLSAFHQAAWLPRIQSPFTNPEDHKKALNGLRKKGLISVSSELNGTAISWSRH